LDEVVGMNIAACTYSLDTLSGFDAFASKQTHWLERAAQQGAQIAVLPEYLALELLGGEPDHIRTDFAKSLHALQRWREAWMALFAGLAQRLSIEIAAGSFLLEHAPARYRNRADVFLPTGQVLHQDKLHLTGFERASGLIDEGDVLTVYGMAPCRGVAVCYDAEFPLLARAQAEHDARLLLVPSCTDTAAGARRVEVGCLARALENRLIVACAVTHGVLPWSPALDVNTGAASVYAPMDIGWPADGIVCRQIEPGWAIAEIDFATLDDPTRPAQVANDRDWRAAPPVQRWT
jgi:predicted amidohydrolase